MKFLAASFVMTAALAAFCIAYMVVFRHERRHIRISNEIADRFPAPLEFTYECDSMDELRSLDSGSFLVMAAGDFYFGHCVRRYAAELYACRDAYMKLVKAESGLNISDGAMSRSERIVTNTVNKLRFVYVKWEYKDPEKRFGKVYSGGCTIGLDRCVEVTRHAEPGAYHMYNRDRFLSVVKKMARHHNDYPGAWCLLFCPEGIAAKEAVPNSQDFCCGSSDRVWRHLKRYLRRHGGFWKLENALPWGTWVRVEPSPYNYEPDELEDKLCRSAGWM